jgi:RHH-type proline utilization regulon transcriptional repressor/proline dehydrogenase/delta 1-pyrroline-5-carboxylate dehydrogenase
MFPIDTPLGESLFRLAEALPRTPDANNQRALLARLPGLSVPLAQAAVLPLAQAALGAIAHQFVYGETIEKALSRSRREAAADRHQSFSFDMLGEGARTDEDARRNLAHYLEALRAVGCGAAAGGGNSRSRSGVSVKLSAVHPRYEAAQYPRVRGELLARLRTLCVAAAEAGIGLCIDAEESERLALHLDLFAALAGDAQLAAWPGLGLAVQAYQLRAPQAIETVLAAARHRRARGGAPVAVRLVKGAYWDAEIRHAQNVGLDAYPVHTDKALTDLCYLACARTLLANCDLVYPQFATHNAVSAACVLALAGAIADENGEPRFEFQRLHGMGESLQRALAALHPQLPMRVYAPVGRQQELLAYLVRRLLENGANTSFVRQAANLPAAGRLVASGMACLDARFDITHSPLPQPREIYMPERLNAKGYDLSDAATLARVAAGVARERRSWSAAPLINGSQQRGEARRVFSPAQPGIAIGAVIDADPAMARKALDEAFAARKRWAQMAVSERADCMDRLADLLELHLHELMALCVWEAGKTLPDALADVREAVDFCRYYAAQARERFGRPLMLPGRAGETNALSWHGRGVFVCISPWNFPVAIFIGQIAAALVAGNTVAAKPAEQTPLTAFRLARLILEAGVPEDVFHLLPGPGETVGQALIADKRIAGVVFTGSTATARLLQRALAEKDGPLVPFIAETGGLNAMIVDSTALPEQVVDAVIESAFHSAGQRCSSLRMLYLQDEIAPAVLEMLRGAMQTLRLGDPADPATDVGPVIDAAAAATLQEYIAGLRGRGAPIAEAGPLPQSGNFVAPIAFEVGSIADLPGERFGPVLHVARFAIVDLERVIDDINSAGYGLTLGIHTRIDARAELIRSRAAVGNVYVNRNMIGAAVGAQPFGGEGLSGTGPKAGGPHYLQRFATERVFTVNTAAAGGDVNLLSPDRLARSD